jgi:hypothetical protein
MQSQALKEINFKYITVLDLSFEMMFRGSENRTSPRLEIHNENTITFTAHIDLKDHAKGNLSQLVNQGLQSSHLPTRNPRFVGLLLIQRILLWPHPKQEKNEDQPRAPLPLN